jgi:hypothetical protein
MLKIQRLSGVNIEEIMMSNRSNRARAINDIRHKATNYDEIVHSLVINDNNDLYEGIAEQARELVYEIIWSSNCTKYEKYLFHLYNKRWDFYKKSDITLRGEK